MHEPAINMLLRSGWTTRNPDVDPIEQNKLIELFARHKVSEALAVKQYEYAAVCAKVALKARRRIRYYRHFFNVQNRQK